jgi:tetratricopeptide (TPR) repeat protein
MTMSSSDTGLTGELALGILSIQVLQELRWLFRAQPVSDWGIDAHAEMMVDGEATGRILAIQSKGGPSYFRKPTPGGWYHPVKAKHARYWQNHSLPVVVVLVDVENQLCYWAQVTAQTLIETGKNFKILVPETQRVALAAIPWSDIVDASFDDVERGFDQNLRSLAPSVGSQLQKVGQENLSIAAMIAATLVASRSNPGIAASEMVENHEYWLTRGGLHACLAVALFAQEHGDSAGASDAFIRASNEAPQRAAHYLALAALQANSQDVSSAQALLDTATEKDEDSSTVLIVALALKAGLGSGRVHSLDPSDVSQLKSFERNSLALSCLAALSEAAQELSEAIRYREAVLDIEPESSQSMIALSDTYLRRSHTSDSQNGDLRRAAVLAKAALAQRRRWTEDTVGTLALLGSVLAFDHQYAEALRQLQKAPDGDALAHEASNSQIARLAIGAALQIGNNDLVQEIVNGMGQPVERRLAEREFLERDSMSTRDRIKLHTTLLDQAQGAGPIEELARQVTALAFLGIDRKEALERAIAEGRIDPAYSELIAAITLRVINPPAAIPVLRALAESKLGAAELLVDAYIEVGDLESALNAAVDSYETFRSPTLKEMEVQILLRGGRREDAGKAIEAAISADLVTGTIRTKFRLILAESAAQKQDWSNASSLYAAALADDKFAAESTVWNLVLCEVHLTRWEEARKTIDIHRLRPVTEREIAIWAQINTNTEWTDGDAALAVELAQEREQDPQLAMKLVMTVIRFGKSNPDDASDLSQFDERPALGTENLAKAHQILGQLIEQHGNKLGVEAFSSTDGDLIEQLSERVRQNHNSELPNLVRNVQRGLIPVGMLAELVGRPYALLLAQRALGARMVSDATTDAYQLGIDAANAAIGKDVVADASAIEFALLLDDLDTQRRRFRTVKITRSTRRDATAAVSEARTDTSSKGHLWWDSYNQRMRMTEFDAENGALVYKAVQRYHSEVRRLSSVEVSKPYLSFRGAEDPEDDRHSALDGMWIETIELAFREGTALWSDDACHRQVARAFGVPAFGTLDLIEAIRFAEIATAEGDGRQLDILATEQHEFILRMMRLDVVDLPVSLEDVLAQIEIDEGSPSSAATVLSRAAWWTDQGSIQPWQRIYDLVQRLRPEAVAQWQYTAMTGVARALEGDPIDARRKLAEIALAGCTEEGDADRAVVGLLAADRIASELDLGSVIDDIRSAASPLASATFDLPGSDVLASFVGKLP